MIRWCDLPPIRPGEAISLSVEETLDIISRAWTTPDDDDYCVFMPWIPSGLPKGESRGKHWQESQPFRWPADKQSILGHMARHQTDDLFWTPVLYDGNSRVKELVAENHCLYADLDEVDPRKIDPELRPTIAWRTSPGRYQALWILEGDIVGATDEGTENHRLTYLLKADRGGWDATQVLRLPGWRNYKAEYVDEDGRSPLGKLLWTDGPSYPVTAFKDLPEVLTFQDVADVLDDEINAINRDELLAKFRLKIPARIRALLRMRDTQDADRSETLWDIERSLADIGMTAAMIVAVVRPTVWNKYRGRGDEMTRLKTEAAKAVALRPEKVEETLEAERETIEPQQLFRLLEGIVPPTWMVDDIWQVGSRGFLAGEPKSYKTWIAMDFALSVASGLPFLGRFKVATPVRVLFIQEEDPASMIQQRMSFFAAKDRMFDPAGYMRKNGKDLEWIPPNYDLPLDMVVMQGTNLSDPIAQEWLQSLITEKGYGLVIADPFNYIVGAVEIERPEVTAAILRPMIQVVGDAALMLVHHMKKSGDRGGRGGARMLGSTHLHGWTQEAMYLFLEQGGVRMDRESKGAPFRRWSVRPIIRNHGWYPEVVDETDENKSQEETQSTAKRDRAAGKVEKFMSMNPGEEFTTEEVARGADISHNGAWRQLKRLQEEGKVSKNPDNSRWVWLES